jgi:hypothetical protein
MDTTDRVVIAGASSGTGVEHVAEEIVLPPKIPAAGR